MTNTFIDVGHIESLLESNRSLDLLKVREVLTHAREMKGLTMDEVACLLNIEDHEVWEEVFQLARDIKQAIYGQRIVLFAPLYISNYCSNDCVYCGFRCSNTAQRRIALNDEQLKAEVLALERTGHKRLLMVYGEHPKWGIDYMRGTIETAYKTRTEDGKGEIRRVNINAAPMSVADYRQLKEAGIGTYQVFQETYHPGRYAEVHPRGTKADYPWRLYALHRAQEGGLDDVAVGALFGLYDWKFEVLGLLAHALDMEKHFNVGPHTVSFPRLEPAINTPFTRESPYMVSDRDFRRLVAVIRLMVPYTGMILTARETAELRTEVMRMGVSQIDGGTRIDIGGYQKGGAKEEAREQFTIHDNRSLDEVVRELAEDGYIPSFCTACYRSHRTGADFMEIAKDGHCHTFCQPNAILTFTEFLNDYASPETRAVGMRLVAKALTELEENQKRITQKKLDDINAGKRDVYL